MLSQCVASNAFFYNLTNFLVFAQFSCFGFLPQGFIVSIF